MIEQEEATRPKDLAPDCAGWRCGRYGCSGRLVIQDRGWQIAASVWYCGDCEQEYDKYGDPAPMDEDESPCECGCSCCGISNAPEPCDSARPE